MKLLIFTAILLSTLTSMADQINDEDGAWLLSWGTEFTASKDLFIRANTRSLTICNGQLFYSETSLPAKEVYKECYTKQKFKPMCHLSLYSRTQSRFIRKDDFFRMNQVNKYEGNNPRVHFLFISALGSDHIDMECRLVDNDKQRLLTFGEMKKILNGFLKVNQPAPEEVGTCYSN